MYLHTLAAMMMMMIMRTMMMIMVMMMMMIANVLAPLLQYSLKMLLQLVEHSVKSKPTLDCSIFPAIFSENAAATSRIFCQLKKNLV